MAPRPQGSAPPARPLTLWWVFVGALAAGAVVIWGAFLLYMNVVGWVGSFPVAYASAAATWGVFLVVVVALLEAAGVGRFGAPHAAPLRRPWVPFAAILVGVAVGYLFWK